KRSALVGREAARQPDGHYVGIENVGGIALLGRRYFTPEGGERLALTDKRDHPALTAAVRLEQFLVGNFLNQIPGGWVSGAVAPVGLQVLIVEIGQVPV